MSTDNHLDALLAAYPESMTPAEVAGVLRLTEETVRRQLGEGLLPGYRMNRHWVTAKSELKAYLQARHNSKDVEVDQENSND